jgi:hypothetical protein
MLTGFGVLAEGPDMFTLRNVDTGGIRLPSGNLSFVREL